MKLKKILPLFFIWITTIGIVTPTLVNISNSKNIKTNIINNETLFTSNSSETKVNYDELEIEWNNYQEHKSLCNMYYDNDNKLTLDQIQKITDLQNNYINIFKINNYSLEQIKFYMCENFPQYKEEYKKSVKTINFNINWINNEVSDTNLFFKISSSDEEKIQSKKDELKRSVPDLESHRSKYIIWCSIASAAAAGFFAAAFWTFGATIPFGVAATQAATQFGIGQDLLKKEIDAINELVDINIIQLIYRLNDIKNIANLTQDIIHKFNKLIGLLNLVSWMIGPVGTIISIANSAWFKIFKFVFKRFLDHMFFIVNFFDNLK